MEEAKHEPALSSSTQKSFFLTKKNPLKTEGMPKRELHREDNLGSTLLHTATED